MAHLTACYACGDPPPCPDSAFPVRSPWLLAPAAATLAILVEQRTPASCTDRGAGRAPRDLASRRIRRDDARSRAARSRRRPAACRICRPGAPARTSADLAVSADVNRSSPSRCRTSPTTGGSPSSASTTRPRPAATGIAVCPSWAHGYPVAEQNLMRIMNEISFLHAHDDAVNTMSLDDPRAVQVSRRLHHRGELVDDDRPPGRAAARRTSKKGGFVIVDDFKAEGDFGSAGWAPFEANMQRVLPGAQFVEMEASHPIFHSFFEIELARALSAGLQRRAADLLGICSRTTTRPSAC